MIISRSSSGRHCEIEVTGETINGARVYYGQMEVNSVLYVAVLVLVGSSCHLLQVLNHDFVLARDNFMNSDIDLYFRVANARAFINLTQNIE